MKRLIIPAIALLAGTAALNAQSSSGFTYDVQQIPVAPFQKVRVNAYVHIVLVPNDTLHGIFVEGDASMLNSLAVSSNDGELVTNATRVNPHSDNIVVTIPVSSLKTVQVKGETKIETVRN
jgi:Protein of unknown function (DUF2807).